MLGRGTGKLKGVDDFFYVLVIALALIIIFSVVSVFLPYSPTSGGGGGGPPGTGIMTIAEFTIGDVGYSEDEPRSTSLGSFVVGEPQSEPLKSLPQVELSTGWFGSQSETFDVTIPEHLRDSIRDVIITFNVYETNQYANLNVVWNGKSFHAQKSPRGDVRIKIDSNFIQDSNTMELTCDGPGLAFWAATVYTLRSFDVNLNYGPTKYISFEVGQGEMESFDRAELSFIGFGSTMMRVKINGFKIWEGVPEGVETIKFNYTSAPIKLGNNIMALDSPNGEITLNNARFDLYLLTNMISRTRNFDITASQYNLLYDQGKKATLSFRVDSVMRTGKATISINGRNLDPGLITEGWNSVEFGSNIANSGKNTIEFSGTGHWDISDARIIIG